jgi:hypothetical protein
MTIEDFHTKLEPQITAKGQTYFMQGAVLELVKEDDGKWGAIVIGTEEYEVEVFVEGMAIQASQCDCPYDHGLICKHEVAVYFAIREDTKRENFANDTGLPQKLIRSLPFEKQVEEVGKKVEKADLLQFIIGQGESNREFREAFLIHFGEHLGEDPTARLRRNIQHIVRSAEGSKSYLNLKDTESVADSLRELWEKHQNGEIADQVRKLILEAITESRKSAEDFEGYLKMLEEELAADN